MMPPISLHTKDNLARAKAIGNELLKRDYDIVCLEKVFENRARKVLTAELETHYPYRCGPANSGCCCSIKANSGVWVLSKFPIHEIGEIEFSDCGGIECMSRKGAMLLEANYEGHQFELLATHLQGEEGPVLTEKNNGVRKNQMEQIAEELLEKNSHPGVPIFICGDFGTPRRDEANPQVNSTNYIEMLKILAAQNDERDRTTLNDNLWRNDLAQDNTYRTSEEDYIFIKPNGAHFKITRDVVLLRNSTWDGAEHNDLSYRYAVSAEIQF